MNTTMATHTAGDDSQTQAVTDRRRPTNSTAEVSSVSNAPTPGTQPEPDVIGEDADEASEWADADHEALVERVLKVVDYQTGGRRLTDADAPEGESADTDLRLQLPGTTARVIVSILGSGGKGEDPGHITEAIADAVDRGDLVTWTRSGGSETRYTRRVVEDLRYLHIWLSKESEARELIEWAHRLMRTEQGRSAEVPDGE